ncbi:hypothetical protein HPB47_027015, partial [Ixodes persulcatus]
EHGSSWPRHVDDVYQGGGRKPEFSGWPRGRRSMSARVLWRQRQQRRGQERHLGGGGKRRQKPEGDGGRAGRGWPDPDERWSRGRER